MSDVDVKIGTGSFDDFNVHIDAKWPAVPRAVETIVLYRAGGNVAGYNVRAVQYAVGPEDQLIGARILVEQVPNSSIDDWLKSLAA